LFLPYRGNDVTNKAFTLIELLVVVAIIGVLLAIITPVGMHCIEEARKGREISAARKLVGAYLTYASDHDGVLMPGYKSESATDATGQPLGFPANARYPWRIAPYLDYDMKAILFNGNENALKEQADSHYAASVAPNLGMNVTFVGGDYGSTSDLMPNERAFSRFGNFCVTRLSQAASPSSLIVFASARRSKKEPGFYQIKSPNLSNSRWGGEWNPEASADSWGYVDMRYRKKAVAAMLDGHVALLDEDEIKDMRRWSNQAAEQNDPNFKLKRQ
jgi:prepilin-type N-terminal cleavage/methylation domain-containing protein